MRKIIMMLLMLSMALFLTGCRQEPAATGEKNPPAATQGMDMDRYLATVREQSAALKASLEKDSLTQTELNQKSGELAALWDGALAYLLEEAEKALSEAERAQLAADQKAWMESKQQAMNAAGKEFEGGSMYTLTVNLEAATLTEARVTELAEQLKTAK